MCTGTTNPQQVQCSVEKVQKYETPKEKHSGWNIESHLSTFWPSTSVPIRLIASLNNVSNLPESIYRQRLPAQLSKTSFLNLSFLSGFSRRFTGDISEVFTQHPPKISHKLSRQETPNSVKTKMHCMCDHSMWALYVWPLYVSTLCVTTLCEHSMLATLWEHSMCDHSMWALYVWALYVSTLCVSTLCVTTLCVTTLCVTTLCEHSNVWPLYVSTLCVSTLCVTTLWEHSMCDHSMWALYVWAL